MTAPLVEQHDAVLLDLDGTVYRGDELVRGAKEAIDEVHRRRVALRYVTNNASKPPRAVVEHLGHLGLCTETAEVSTSAQAAAAVLAEFLPAGARVLVIGTEALAGEIEGVGLSPVRRHADGPVAVVQGHSPDTGWMDLGEACLAINGGAAWVACNSDATLPTERGELPGNGAMVAALQLATDRMPRVAGKPQPPLLRRAADSARASRPLMVGDRLETDIAGGVQAGMPSLMVLSGVGTPAEVLGAPAESRPDYVSADLAALHRPPEESLITDQSSFTVRVEESALVLTALSEGIAEPLPALRALCAVWWRIGSGPVRVRGDDEQAEMALNGLGLA
ncbi:HAD-IIA family hydrolase [Haloactinomyces albus]|uniref:HAD superfamily hydrolase (TIGR01450 family) n=1 Tax=Haloactinomyces albus TaxID=1352928 RepID=A0AAE4CLU5_9ACTN|nr:HAD-IIA family hydrolase [Haloactinomyces albus]MDR7300312.1 HAD superfamily hydrolase (TIGR01450 family) [Haloactinomyces albus]